MAVIFTVRTQGHDGSFLQFHGSTLFLPKQFNRNVTSRLAIELIIFLCCYVTKVSHHDLALPCSVTLVRLDPESTSFRQPSGVDIHL